MAGRTRSRSSAKSSRDPKPSLDPFVVGIDARSTPASVELSPTAPVDLDALAVPVASDRLGDESRGLPWEYLRARGFEGSLGSVEAFPDDLGVTVFAVGVGPSDQVGVVQLRRAAAFLAAATMRHRVVATTIHDAASEGVSATGALRAVAEGLILGSHSPRTARSGQDGRRFVLVGRGGRRGRTAIEDGRRVGRAVVLARELVNAPASDLTPRRFCEVAHGLLSALEVEVEVWDARRIESESLGGVSGVSRGSAAEPRLLIARYRTEKRSRGRVVLIGKGVTFDSGGLSLKSHEGMMSMRDDMGGAAAVVSVLMAVAEMGMAVDVSIICPLAENMVDARALKPGDVLRMRDGKTVEVLNTDAEGRLMLADALSLAAEEDPTAIVDVATLTGACHLALGSRIAGLFCTDARLAESLRLASEVADEPVWELPLYDPYKKFLSSDFADLRNVGVRHGAAIQAALFLREFVPDGIPWAHLDIAGPVWSSDGTDPLWPRGGTGFGVRLLVEFLRSFRRRR